MAKIIKLSKTWGKTKIEMLITATPKFREFFQTLSNKEVLMLQLLLDYGLDKFVKESMQIAKDRNDKRKGIVMTHDSGITTKPVKIELLNNED